MNKEFNLSEKIREWNIKTGWEQKESFGGAAKFYREEDVKEFIKRLKELGTIKGKDINGKEIISKWFTIHKGDLDKLAGASLI